MKMYGCASSIVGVRIADDTTGSPVVNVLSIPVGSRQVLVSNLTVSAIKVALSEGDLDSDFSSFRILPNELGNIGRFYLPEGVGQLYMTADQPCEPGQGVVQFWIS